MFGCGGLMVSLWWNAWLRWTRDNTLLDYEKYATIFNFIFEWCCLLSGGLSWKDCNIWRVLGFGFDSEQIRFFGGHPFVCGWRSYYQQGFKQTQNLERIIMQTVYVGIAFSTMVILPLLVAKWSGTRNEDFRDFMRRVE